MRLLSIDTSGQGWSLAVQEEDTLLAASVHLEPQKAASLLMPTIQSLLREGGISFKSLEGIAVGRGPGSFTSLRVGLSTARGLAFALQCPLFALSAFEIVYGTVCLEKRRQSGFYVLLDTRGSTLCLQYFPPFPGPPGAALFAPATEIVALLGGKKEPILGDPVERLTSLRVEQGDFPNRAVSLGTQVLARQLDPALLETTLFYGPPLSLLSKTPSNDG